LLTKSGKAATDWVVTAEIGEVRAQEDGPLCSTNSLPDPDFYGVATQWGNPSLVVVRRRPKVMIEHSAWRVA